MKLELCESNGIVLRENRIVLPYAFHEKAITIVHQGHLGMEKSKQLLRSKVYWKGMDKDVNDTIAECRNCQSVGPKRYQHR